jgi:L-rhamnose mutarotase
MHRRGQVIGIKPERITEYEALHAAVWPEVLATIESSNIRNYSIFRYETFLFSYFEYVGVDFEADMAKMAADPKTQEWWKLCNPMQQPVEPLIPGQWWKPILEIFHTD